MKRYALVGAGMRALHMFARPMAKELKDDLVFCGVYDKNPVRTKLLSEDCGGIPVFDDFGRMLEEARPDVVVVASTDNTHHYYIIEAMEAGCDVISEKPMTIDADKAALILEAEKRTGRNLTVTFNLRFAPYFARVKQLLAEGAIGEIDHISLDWYLDRVHGAEYFRRWHAELANSGGLLVHKSTHHFDIVNWWMDSHPSEVHAFGSRRFYGPTRSERGERCLTCEHKTTCEFYYDLSADPIMDSYYLQAESEDGYYRDQCVFGGRIDIYDNMSVNARYESGALLTYSLVAYSPYEGWKATINGRDGRMELENRYGNFDMSQSSNSVIRIVKPDGEVITVEVPSHADGHGGGDQKLRRMLFKGDVADPLGQQAGSLAGAMSLMIGDAANRSIQTGSSVYIDAKAFA